MKTKVIGLVVGLILVFSSFSTVFADTPSADKEKGGNIEPCLNKIITRTTVIKTETKENQFVGYNSMTPDWAPVSKYTLSAGKSYSWSGTYTWEKFTFKLSGSKSNTVKREIPADSKKYSRLAVKHTMKYKKIKVEKIMRGKVYETYYTYTSEKIGAPTTYVKYK